MKYFGEIGYGMTTETSPSVWEEEIIKKQYFGDVLSYTKRYQSSEHLNDDIEITNRISIIGDPFAYANFAHIRYLTWMGQKWKVSSVDVEYPRLILTVGGVYTEEVEPAYQHK